MTQADLYRYAYRGALSTLEGINKAMRCDDGIYLPGMYSYLADTQADVETLRVLMESKRDPLRRV